MTQQDDITQLVLTDDEIRGEIHNAIGFGFEPGELQSVNAADLMNVAYVLLSKLRAPVAPEPFRAAFANGVLPATRFHELWQSAAPSKNSGHTMLEDLTWQVGKFAALVAAEVRAPVADERAAFARAITGRDDLEPHQVENVIDANGSRWKTWQDRAALASAPVAPAEVMDALNWVDDFIARCNRDDRGSCESVNVLRRALASAPVAGEAQEYGSPADVAQRIEQYLAQDGRMNSGTQLLYEAMKALRASQGDRNDG